jgi:hypothetical protein
MVLPCPFSSSFLGTALGHGYLGTSSRHHVERGCVSDMMDWWFKWESHFLL